MIVNNPGAVVAWIVVPLFLLWLAIAIATRPEFRKTLWERIRGPWI